MIKKTVILLSTLLILACGEQTQQVPKDYVKLSDSNDYLILYHDSTNTFNTKQCGELYDMISIDQNTFTISHINHGGNSYRISKRELFNNRTIINCDAEFLGGENLATDEVFRVYVHQRGKISIFYFDYIKSEFSSRGKGKKDIIFAVKKEFAGDFKSIEFDCIKKK